MVSRFFHVTYGTVAWPAIFRVLCVESLSLVPYGNYVMVSVGGSRLTESSTEPILLVLGITSDMHRT